MGDTTFCSHCKRDVPSVTFALHSAHCARFIETCSKCNEPVPKKEMAEHIQQMHNLVACKTCKQQVEKGNLTDHIANECPGRMIPCEFCEMDCTASNIQEHQLLCGSRTERCEICHNLILVRMLKAHGLLHKGDSKQDQTVQSSAANESVKVANNTKGEVKPFKQQPTFPVSNTKGSSEASGNSNVVQKQLNDQPHYWEHSSDTASAESVPCEFCQKSIILHLLEEHQVLCGTTLDTCRHCRGSYERCQRDAHICRKIGEKVDTEYGASKTASDSLGGNTSGQSEHRWRAEETEDDYWAKYAAVQPHSTPAHSFDNEDPSIPCEQCGVPFPLSCLELHQVACKFGDNEGNMRRDMRSAVQQAYAPCRFCDVAVASDLLESHEAECRLQQRVPSRAVEPVPRLVSAHTEPTNQRRQQPVDGACPTVSMGALKVNEEKECSDQMIPCEYCQIAFATSKIQKHELLCGSRTKQCDICHKIIFVRVFKVHSQLHSNGSKHNRQAAQSTHRENVGVGNEGCEEPGSKDAVLRNVSQTPLPARSVNASNGGAIPKQRRGQFGVNINSTGVDESLPCDHCHKSFAPHLLEEHQLLCDARLGTRHQQSNGKATVDSEVDYWLQFGASSAASDKPNGSDSKDVNEDDDRTTVADEGDDDDYWRMYGAGRLSPTPSVEDDGPTVCCELCGVPFPASSIKLHQEACKLWGNEANGGQQVVRSVGEPVYVSCSFCDVAVGSDYLETHEAECRLREQQQIAPAPRFIPPAVRRVERKPKPVDVACSVCGAIVTSDILEMHEARCGHYLEETRKRAQRNVALQTLVKTKGDTQPAVPPAASVKSPPPPKEPQPPVDVACSTCGVIVSSDILEMHEARCGHYLEETGKRFKRVVRAKTVPEPRRYVRPETAVQRRVRQNALMAAEDREQTNPKIRQSAYEVVHLPSGQEVLKKRNCDDGSVDAGHVLGRGDRRQFREEPAYEQRNSGRGAPGNQNGIIYSRRRAPFSPAPSQNRTSIPNGIRAGQRAPNSPFRPAPSQDLTAIANRIAKKPNAAFRTNAVEPDAGHVLGSRNGGAASLPQPGRRPPPAELGARPKDRRYRINSPQE